MSDDERSGDAPVTSTDPATADTGEGPRKGRGGGGRDVDVGKLVTYGQWGALLALGILAIVAGIGLYTSLSSIIDVWIGDRYQPFARAVVNFGVLCVAAAGIVLVLRRQ